MNEVDVCMAIFMFTLVSVLGVLVAKREIKLRETRKKLKKMEEVTEVIKTFFE